MPPSFEPLAHSWQPRPRHSLEVGGSNPIAKEPGHLAEISIVQRRQIGQTEKCARFGRRAFDIEADLHTVAFRFGMLSISVDFSDRLAVETVMPVAIQIATTGGPEVLRLTALDVGAPAVGEILLRHTAIGVNYIDTYHRSGAYPTAVPGGIGVEAAGVVEAIGTDVADFAVGDRVGYCLGPIGAYASHRLIGADRVVPLPDLISDEVAAAVMLKGGTTEFLVERCAKVEAGQTVLVHAAAGGVGQLLVQWLRSAGARVIATVGDADKALLAREAGADEVILYRSDDVAANVAELTSGAGVDVVFDGVGRDTWDASLRSLRPRGLLVSFGSASGPVTGVDLSLLARSGSVFVTRPTMYDYYATVDERHAGLGKVFDRVIDESLTVKIGQRFALSEAEAAHRALEARETTGSTILIL